MDHFNDGIVAQIKREATELYLENSRNCANALEAIDQFSDPVDQEAWERMRASWVQQGILLASLKAGENSDNIVESDNIDEDDFEKRFEDAMNVLS